MKNDEYELIVDKSCNYASSQLNHTKTESLLLDHRSVACGTSTLPQGKTRVGRLCEERLALIWSDVIGSGKHRTRSKRLDLKTRTANEKQIFAFYFPLQCHCFLVSRLFYHEKHFHQLFFFSQPNLLHFHTEFISQFRFPIQLQSRNSPCFFLLTVKSKEFRFHTHFDVSDKNEIFLRSVF